MANKSIEEFGQNILKPYIDGCDEAYAGNIAPVETDATKASKAYSIGDQLILNSVLYDVTANIAKDDALTVGTNIAAADDITTQIKNHTVTTDAVPTKNSTNPVQSGGVYNSEKATREVIAPVEEDATSASQGYAQGTQLILNGVLYDVTAAITQGDALTVGTNIVAADNVVTQLSLVNTGLANEATTRSAMGAKNVFDNLATSGEDSTNGLTYTVNADKSVTVSATSGSYPVTLSANSAFYVATSVNLAVSGMKLSGCPSNGSDSSYSLNARYIDNTWADREYGNGIILANNINALAIVLYKDYELAAPLTFKPMIRLATDSDATYQPYAETNVELTGKVSSLNSAFVNNVNQNGCKNILPNYATPFSSGGANVAIDDDGIITVTASSTLTGNCNIYPVYNSDATEEQKFYLEAGTYKASGCPANGSSGTYYIQFYNQSDGQSLGFDYGDGFEFTITGKKWIVVRASVRNGYTISGSVVFKPMITLSTDVPSNYANYVPPTKTNRQLTEDSVTWDDLSEVGAVNHCKNNATTTTTTDGTTIFTWTVNEDKSVTVSAPSYPVTVASNQILIPWDDISADECSYLVGKVFKLTGCPSGGSRETYRLQIYRVLSADGSLGTAEEYGEGYIFEWLNNGSGTKAKVQMVIASGYTMTGPLTFKPMLTDTSYNGPYVPYAKTNKELTEDVTPQDVTFSQNDTYLSDVSYFKINKIGKTVHISGYFQVSTTAPKNTVLFSNIASKPSNREYAIVGLTNSDTDFRVIFLDPNGSIKVESDTGLAVGYYVINASYTTA